jgi:hypothetical protein
MKKALVLITKIPSIPYLQFLDTFTHYDVFVIIDSNEYDITEIATTYPKIRCIQINNDECETNHYCNSSQITLEKMVSGWDKAIYYFSTINTNYDYVWFMEDDVFIYDEKTLLQIDDKYVNADLLCNSNYSESKIDEWLWDKIHIEIPYPYFCGMVCCSRLSSALLKCILNYTVNYKSLFFIEAMFPTLAKYHNLETVIDPTEMLTITWNQKATNYSTTNIFHPNKDIAEHTAIRERLDTHNVSRV